MREESQRSVNVSASQREDTMGKRWYRDAYRRSVVDMHITDWDERFMSEFDARDYVDMLVLARVRSAVVYAHSHVGLCYFPSKVGPMHKGLKGRNILGEVIDLCHHNGISVVAYCSGIFDTWAYRNNPDWRIIRANGEEAAKESRYGICCPNSPYRNYAAGIAEEICERFDLEGIRFDMTFWPCVCYCPHCRSRFAEEVGVELPTVINWEDPCWVSFQRKREEWLAEFGALLTATAKRASPDVSVEHQASTYLAGWQLGVTEKLARHNDFLQGDFYGGPLQGSVARKLFHNLSQNLPGAFETSIGVDLRNYTALKSNELIKAKVSASLADACAFVFIDSIDPLGTLNRAVYERMGDIFKETGEYERYVGGTPCQDVAVYLSTESKCDFADNGKTVDDPHLSSKIPHVEAAVSACKSLIDNHIPFGVITRRNLDSLSRHQIVVLPNMLMMDHDEARAFREYVRNGGNLYASKLTSLMTVDGEKQADFMLADVFGASYRAETRESFTYVAPAECAEHLFAGYTARRPLGLSASQIVVEARPGAKILAKVTLPYTDPADPIHFASIHNDPPGVSTEHPAVILNRFGKGKAIYAAADIESLDPHRDVFVNLIRFLEKSFAFEACAPKSVEITVFHQEDQQRFIVSVVNFQRELPNIPVDDIKMRVRTNEKSPRCLLLLPEERRLSYEMGKGYVEFVVPRLETFQMLALDYD